MIIFFKKIIQEKRSLFRKLFFLSFDFILIFLAIFSAFLLRFDGKIPPQHFLNMEGMIFFALLITLPLFYFFKLYSFSWAYVSTGELISLFKAIFLSFSFLATLIFILRDQPAFIGFPRSIIFISYFLIFIFCGTIRFLKRIYLQVFNNISSKEKERTLIVGAGAAGEQILRSILHFKASPYLPLGFADDDSAKQGILIHGLKVFGKIKDIPRIVKENNIEGLIVALPSAGSKTIKEAVEQGRISNLKKIRIIPSINEIIDGRVSIRSLREVQIEDLLGRNEVSLDQNLIENSIKNKKILITGAAGSIGSELCRQVLKFNPEILTILDQDETGVFNIAEELKIKFPKIKLISLIADISDKIRIEKIFNEIKPQLIFHAAAYKHVPLMEDHAEEAVKNNILGTKILGEMAKKYGIEKFIFISTDKAVNPSSIMGASKRVGEMICQSLNNGTKFVSVRFGNVLDSRGSVIPIFKEQIKKGGPVEITHPEMKRYFMTTSEACLLVMQAGAMGQGGEIFVLNMGEPIKILDLAKELIKLSGFEPDKDIPIVFTNPRPGEKFFEEILTAEEGTTTTYNKKIFIAKSKQINKEKLTMALETLKKEAEEGNKKAIIETLKEIIPTFYH